MRTIRTVTALLFLPLILLVYVGAALPPDAPYGVLIGAEPEDMARQPVYQTVVIDGAYFTKEEIGLLHR
jgi:hypothetical protein